MKKIKNYLLLLCWLTCSVVITANSSDLKSGVISTRMYLSKYKDVKYNFEKTKETFKSKYSHSHITSDFLTNKEKQFLEGRLNSVLEKIASGKKLTLVESKDEQISENTIIPKEYIEGAESVNLETNSQLFINIPIKDFLEYKKTHGFRDVYVFRAVPKFWPFNSKIRRTVEYELDEETYYFQKTHIRKLEIPYKDYYYTLDGFSYVDEKDKKGIAQIIQDNGLEEGVIIDVYFNRIRKQFRKKGDFFKLEESLIIELVAEVKLYNKKGKRIKKESYKARSSTKYIDKLENPNPTYMLLMNGPEDTEEKKKIVLFEPYGRSPASFSLENDYSYLFVEAFDKLEETIFSKDM